MSRYLNWGNAYFQMVLNSDVFVDKSMLISVTNSYLNTSNKFMCVTRMRRSGKTIALSMLNAYYSKGCDSKSQFKGLKIENDKSYLEHLNKHNVIWVDLTGIYCDIGDKDDFVFELEKSLLEALKDSYGELLNDNDKVVKDCIKKIKLATNESFIVLIDEWDIIFREQPENKTLGEKYLRFLNDTFTSSDVSECFELVCITGIYPISRYTNIGLLSDFKEYNMINSQGLAEYFGFTENEVENLCSTHIFNFSDIKRWYKGYELEGVSLYNPLSIDRTIFRNKCSDYWTHTSSRAALSIPMNYNNGELKDLIIKMMLGEKVPVNVNNFQKDLTRIDSKDSALTVLIHLGYLAYDETNKSCYIPNYEISLEFENALQDLHWDLIYTPIKRSLKMYDETLKGNTDYINLVFDENHKDFASVLNKNKEDILSVITMISYYAIKPYYNVLKEVNTTLGRADIIYIPQDDKRVPLIIELNARIGKTATDTIDQIKTKKYMDALGPYKGDVALVGIAYNPETLKHSSLVEIIKL